jgi:hypothetical protein
VNSTGAVSIVKLGSIILPTDPTCPARRREAVPVCGNDRHPGQSDQSNHFGDTVQNPDAREKTREEMIADSRPVSSSEVVDELMARVVAPCLALGQRQGWGQGQKQGLGQCPSLSVLKGVLLLGPPGVGKTFE